MAQLKVTVDRDRCVGSGQCALNLPEVFDQGDADGIVILLTDRPDESLSERVLEAEQLCPAMAIRTEEIEDD
jgi:ferredoxin